MKCTDKILCDLAYKTIAITKEIADDFAIYLGTYENLKKERDELRKYRARLSADADRYIEKSVMAPKCLALCKNVQENFPRELRDLVYEHLLEGSEIKITKCDLGSKSWYHFSQESTAHELTHVLSAGFADDVTRAEFLVSWYRFTSFHFSEVRTAYGFFSRDRLGCGHDPRSLVKSVTVTLELCTSEESRGLERLVKDLVWMYGLRSAAHIELLLWGPVNRRTGNGFWDFVQSLSAIFPILSVLSKTGCKITVKLRNICEFDVKSEELSVKGWMRRVNSGTT
jgi:hypothetical protein